MKKTKLLVMCLAMAVSYLCLAVEPPGAYSEPAAFVSDKSYLPTNNGLVAAESIVLFAVVASAVVLVNRRSKFAIQSKLRALAKTSIALAKCGVPKLTTKQRRSASNDDEFLATNLLATG